MPRETKKIDQLNSIELLTGRIHSLMYDQIRYYVETADVGLKMEHFSALRALMIEDDVPQKTTTKRLGIDRHRMSRLVSELIDHNLVTRERSIMDRRRDRVSLMPVGRAVINAIEQAVTRVTEAALDGLTDADRNHFLQTLNQMLQNLSKKVDHTRDDQLWEQLPDDLRRAKYNKPAKPIRKTRKKKA